MYEKLYALTSDGKRFQKVDNVFETLLPQDEKISDRLEMTERGLANQSYYIRRWAGYPVYQNTDLQFLGESKAILDDIRTYLAKAKKFIFLEWHMLEESVIWKSIEEILQEKAEAGVEVRILLDGKGNANWKYEKFQERLLKKKIRCTIFHDQKTVKNKIFQYMDYRKTLVVDGRYAYTGDFELTNEQFCIGKEKGEWKISCIRVIGDAVRSFTYAFLKMWDMAADETEDPIPYLLKTAYRSAESGFVQPFAVNPLQEEKAGMNAYLNLIRNADRYLYASISENVIGRELLYEMKAAAKRGVKIVLIIPEQGKKKVQPKLQNLLEAGDVRIFQYCSGKLLSKEIVADDNVAIVGNFHMEQKSSNKRFENGCWIAGSRTVAGVKRDIETLLSHCTEM